MLFGEIRNSDRDLITGLRLTEGEPPHDNHVLLLAGLRSRDQAVGSVRPLVSDAVDPEKIEYVFVAGPHVVQHHPARIGDIFHGGEQPDECRVFGSLL